MSKYYDCLTDWVEDNEDILYDEYVLIHNTTNKGKPVSHTAFRKFCNDKFSDVYAYMIP